MVDHATLLKRLSCSFGVSGVVRSCIESYLYGRTQSVRMGSHSSAVTPCAVDAPQGSVLGPLYSFPFILLSQLLPNQLLLFRTPPLFRPKFQGVPPRIDPLCWVCKQRTPQAN